jgi:preprotein translocase subunit SecF
VVDLFRERKWDLIKHRNIWFALSLLVILPGVAALFIRGLNYGIDFTGGGLLSYQLVKPIGIGQQTQAIHDVRAIVNGLGIANQVNLAGSGSNPTVRDQIIIRTQIKQSRREASQQVDEQDRRIFAALHARPEFAGLKAVERRTVSGVVSKELKQRAVLAIVLGTLAILIFITARYDFKYAVSAVIALVHDLLILIGSFALIRGEVDVPFVAAILTVLGFSVHDTIVIFDRIRENVKLRKRPTFAETANLSLLETMARSVNTVLTLEFTLVALFFLGGPTLHHFAVALLIGVTAGAYSSIFNASQILVVWKQREERRKLALRMGAPARAPRPAAPPAPAPRPIARPAPAAADPDGESEEGEQEEVAVSAGGAPEPRLARTARKKLKAKKRKKRY